MSEVVDPAENRDERSEKVVPPSTGDSSNGTSQNIDRLKTVDLSALLTNSASPGQNGRHASEVMMGPDIAKAARPRYLQDAPWPVDIPVSTRAKDHHFAHLIQKEGYITLPELTAALNSKKYKLDMSAHSTGALPAASNEAAQDPNSHISSYSCHSWMRDVAISALAMKRAGQRTGDCSDGVAAVNSLWRFYARPQQRDKLLSFILDSDQADYKPKDWYHDPQRTPHIRAKIEGGELVESPQAWGHQQLDAFGMWMFTAFRFANDSLVDLRSIAEQMGEDVNPHSKEDSIISLGIKFLNRIEFWDQRDVGPWEDFCLPKRATSVGCCVAALSEAIRFFESPQNPLGYNAIPTDDADALQRELHNAYENGLATLTERIPHSGQPAVETDEYPSDAAMSFLLYPFNPGLSEGQENAILRRLYEKHDDRYTLLKSEGFARRCKNDFSVEGRDDYVGQDYIYHRNDDPAKDGTFSNISGDDFREAEWTLFDGNMAGFFAKKFIGSRGEDGDAYALMQRHLKRMLSQPTTEIDTLTIAASGDSVAVPQFVVPEAYFYDTQQDKWRANHNTPLLMSNAAHALALERIRDAIELRDILAANPH